MCRIDKKGFTLLEVMVAMAIMASALLLLVNSWSGAFMRVRKAQEAFEMSTLIERKMAELDVKYRSKPLDSIPANEEGEFDDVENFTWTMESRKLEIPDMTALLIGQEGGADQMLISVIKQMTDAMSKSVKEMKLTVIYTKGKKPIKHSVTTYFVDYDKDIALGAPGGPGG